MCLSDLVFNLGRYQFDHFIFVHSTAPGGTVIDPPVNVNGTEMIGTGPGIPPPRMGSVAVSGNEPCAVITNSMFALM